jgi:hypothetical protein
MDSGTNLEVLITKSIDEINDYLGGVPAKQFINDVFAAVNNVELIEKSRALLQAMNQYDFYINGYANGSASISEVNQAAADQHKAYSELFDIIQKTK